VIVAIATDDHNAATIATVDINRLRHRAPPNPKFPFCISTPKPVGTLVVSLKPLSTNPTSRGRFSLARSSESCERGLATIPQRTLSRRWHALVTSLKHSVWRYVIILFLPSPRRQFTTAQRLCTCDGIIHDRERGTGDAPCSSSAHGVACYQSAQVKRYGVDSDDRLVADKSASICRIDEQGITSHLNLPSDQCRYDHRKRVRVGAGWRKPAVPGGTVST
jgi:hypothetical protein